MTPTAISRATWGHSETRAQEAAMELPSAAGITQNFLMRQGYRLITRLRLATKLKCVPAIENFDAEALT
jgi:hypothetical protein